VRVINFCIIIIIIIIRHSTLLKRCDCKQTETPSTIIYIFIRHKAASKQTNNCTNRQTDKRQRKKNRKTML